MTPPSRHWQSTPLNYLEKIFQIPFALRPMQCGGFQSLIDDLTALQVKGEVSRGEPPAEPPPAPGQQPPQSRGAPDTRPRATQPGATPTPSRPAATTGPGPQATAAQPVQPARAASPVTATDEPAISMSPDFLRIEDRERDLMKSLFSLMPSPRAVKRFVNIYRLLRASARASGEAFISGQGEGPFTAAMLLLAIQTGYPAEAAEMIHQLVTQKPQKKWWGFIDSFKVQAATQPAPTPNGSQGATSSATAPTGSQAATSCAAPNGSQTPGRVQNGETSGWNELLEKLSGLRQTVRDDRSCADFVKWAPEVARYSFQAGHVVRG
jgi:hypothetical protein